MSRRERNKKKKLINFNRKENEVSKDEDKFDKTIIYNEEEFEELDDIENDDEENKSSSNLKKLIFLLVALIILIPIGTFGYFYNKLNSMFHDTSVLEEHEVTLGDVNFKAEDNIKNILLIGTDARPDENVSRSDAMMILTVDNKNKALKITSLNRDTYVNIPGHGNQKLSNAYALGEAALLIKTIEENLEVDIQDYAVVNFLSFMDIVDTLGGVEVEVQQSEISETNKFIRNETYGWSGSTEPMKLIETAGVQKLNGYQALSFSRIRYNDSTIERNRRQSEVLQGMMLGLQQLPISRYPQLLDSVLPHITTSMNASNIITTGMQSLGLLRGGINQVEFPLTNMSTHTTLSSAGFVIQFNPESLDILHDFIFENIQP